MKRIIVAFFLLKISSYNFGQIIADHTVVDKFDDIPQYYIDEVKKMWLTVPGESHSQAYRTGLTLLEALYPAYSVSVTEGGAPEAYTTSNLRASRGTYGDFSNATGWIYSYGEEDWFTNSTAIARTKAGITYCNTHGLNIAAIGFGWCYDDQAYSTNCISRDGIYNVYWFGASKEGPEGNLGWGLDAADFALTGNTVCMDTYLNVTQEYADYCEANGYATKVFFTTGPVDIRGSYEPSYQAYIKHEYIRDFVAADPTRILFDYADILCYDDGSEIPNTSIWNGRTYPCITTTNLGNGTYGHIGDAGAIRLAKAMWWMLARIAGWDGGTSTGLNELGKEESSKLYIEKTEYEIRIKLDVANPFTSFSLTNLHGKLISSSPVRSDILVIDISPLSSGLYFVILSNGRERHTEKVLKP